MKKNADKTVAVLGASNKPDRYSNMAICMLQGAGYRVIPVHPKLDSVEGLTVVHDLTEIDVPVHTLTLYVGPLRSSALKDDIISLKPGRVIFNPGTESEPLEQALRDAGIEIVKGCTLVMLRNGRF